MRYDDLPWPVQGLVRFMLHDEVRIFEVFSALNLLAWAWMLWLHPEILARASYQGFITAAPPVWAVIAFVIGAMQIAAMVLRHHHVARLRFPAMALAAGIWTVIAVHFWAGPPSTAAVNYTLIALGAAISGVYLGWKPTSNNF
ncbi:MAG: hypothetical protein Q4G22_04705 [Paracoccus sp. (in: a-proteobacteria)]|nr:hypothetical protein [Paracoccus sp. (in: a-proteobacteria)]